MKLSKILNVSDVLIQLSDKDTPIKLTVAKNLALTEPFSISFTSAKDDKFNELVKVNEKGLPVPKEEVLKAISEGKINPQNGLPFPAYEFNEESGLKEITDFVTELKDEEKLIEFIPVSLSKMIKVKDKDGNSEDVSLEDLLDSPDSIISSTALKLLIEVGILK